MLANFEKKTNLTSDSDFDGTVPHHLKFKPLAVSSLNHDESSSDQDGRSAQYEVSTKQSADSVSDQNSCPTQILNEAFSEPENQQKLLETIYDDDTDELENQISTDGFDINFWTDYRLIRKGALPDADTCAVCLSSVGEEGNELLFCDKCELCVHLSCYGVEEIPDGNWFCEPCNEGISGVHCCLCPNTSDRALKKTEDGEWIHVNCALWIPEPVFSSEPMVSPVRDIRCVDPRRFDLHCILCKKKFGACIQCSFPTCMSAFHIPCAIQAGFRMEMREKPTAGDRIFFHVFCPNHFSVAKDVESVNSLGLDVMQNRKRKFSGDFNPHSTKRSLVPKIALVPTKLEPDQKKMLERFCKRFGATLKSAFSNSVTHVICKCSSKEDSHMKYRTTKFLFGLATGKWVICFDWISDSLRSGAILPEEDYEVKFDPKARILSRKDRIARTDRVFENMHFSFGDCNDVSKSVIEDVSQLISLEGGRIVPQSSVQRASGAGEPIVIIDSEKNFRQSVDERRSRSHVHVTPTWVFDCLSNLKLLEWPSS